MNILNFIASIVLFSFRETIKNKTTKWSEINVVLTDHPKWRGSKLFYDDVRHGRLLTDLFSSQFSVVNLLVKLCHPKGNVGEYPVNRAAEHNRVTLRKDMVQLKLWRQKHLIAQTKTCFTKAKVLDLIKKTPIVNTMLRCNVGLIFKFLVHRRYLHLYAFLIHSLRS